jgi:segregation and condensation protein A
MEYQVKLPIFEGPMDLLLHLIEKNELDIYNIPIALITKQYMEYLELAGEIDLELTSEFLVMACTLLSIKAKMLLPKPIVEITEEEGPDPRQELVERLLEYKQYKEQAEIFKELEERQLKCFWRVIDDVQLLKKFPPANPVGSLDMDDLVAVLSEVLKKMKHRQQTVSLNREEVTIKDKIKDIVTLLHEKPHGLSFYKLFPAEVTKEEIIVTFLALLELIRREKIFVKQQKLFDDIYIFAIQTEGG